MSFLDFFVSLPFPDEFLSTFLVAFLAFLISLGIYKFVKDWLPW